MQSALGVPGAVCGGPGGDQAAGWESPWVRVGEARAPEVRMEFLHKGALGLVRSLLQGRIHFIRKGP